MTMPARVSLTTPATTKLEWPCRLALTIHGGRDCPFCRSGTNTLGEQAHRQAVLTAIWKNRGPA